VPLRKRGEDEGAVADKRRKHRVEETERRKERRRESYVKAQERSERETKLLLAKAPESDLDDRQGDHLGSDSETNDDSDEDWLDPDTTDYNTFKLRRTSRECDRTSQSNRGGAGLINAALKDLGLVTKDDQSFLVCPNKLRRERLKWGQAAVDRHSAREAPGYFRQTGGRTDVM
jgi:hypothetical protein